MKIEKLGVALGVCALSCAAMAWDVEHDEIAQLTGEFLPGEVAKTFDFADFKILMANCHFPDMTEWPMEKGQRRFHTAKELADRVGEKEAAELVAAGYRNSNWFHSSRGKAAAMVMLARAFANGEHSHAAFYISVLTHSISDESALNHPPLLGFFRYSRLKDIDFTMRKVEDGAKNVFGFRSDGHVCQLARERLAGFVPKAPKANLADSLMALCVDNMVRQSAFSGELEGKIAFAPKSEAEVALADLVAMQIRTLETVVWTCWTYRAKTASLPDRNFDSEFRRQVAIAAKEIDPRPQAVYAGIFNEKLNPSNPKGVVGLVCDAYMREGGSLSYPGRILTAACGRTLRANGHAVKGFAFWELVRDGFPDPKVVPTMLMAIGGTGYMSRGPCEDFAAAARKYRERGGRLIVIGGEDRHDITGFSATMRKHANKEVPVSSGWHKAEAADAMKMALVGCATMPRLEGKRYPFLRDPNFDGFCKPVCQMETPEGEKLLELDNGKTCFAVAVVKNKVAWLPEYAVLPYLFVKDDPKLPLDALPLDAFGEKVLMDAFDTLSK